MPAVPCTAGFLVLTLHQASCFDVTFRLLTLYSAEAIIVPHLMMLVHVDG